MKRIFYYLAFCLLFISRQASGQVTTIDISTGVDATGNLIGLNQPDDDWDVIDHGNTVTYLSPHVPSGTAFTNAYCGSGVIEPPPPPATTVLTYNSGLASTARWICPGIYLNTLGEHTTADVSQYYYKRSFPGTHCDLDSVVLELDSIIADNCVKHITINGNIIQGDIYNNGCWFSAYNYVMGTGVRYLIPLNYLTTDGSPNILMVHVQNDEFYTGLQIKGQIKFYGTVPDASFCISNTGNIFTATSSQTGYHTWEVEGSATGQYGTFVPIITLFQQSVSVPTYGYNCIRFKHKVVNECGFSACQSQSMCRYSCTTGGPPASCELSSAQNLSYTNSTFSWDPVPGASAYIIEILPNSGPCCLIGMVNPTPIIIPTTTASHYQPMNLNCMQWRIKALCENGSSVYSDWQCNSFNGPPGKTVFRQQITGQTNIDVQNNIAVKLFPNPAKGAVTIDIETITDVAYTISIFDITGKLVKTMDPGKTENRKATVKCNTEQLSKGSYLVKIVTSDNHIITHKLLIE